MIDTIQLSSQLETAVRAVPGVLNLYATAHIVPSVVGTILSTLTRRDPSLALVTVSDSEQGLTVSASIGVADEGSATEICRRVHDAIAADVTVREAAGVATISVTVASIG